MLRDFSEVFSSLTHTREERGLLGKPSRVGAGEISTGKAPRERRVGHVYKIVKWKVKIQNRHIDLSLPLR